MTDLAIRLPAALTVLAPAALAAAVLCATAAAQTSPPDDDSTLNVAILVYDGVEILDFAGPAEVFAVAGTIARSGDRPATHVYTVARSSEPIVSQGFVDVIPDHTFAEAPPADIVVLPGGDTGELLADPEVMDWVGRATDHAEVSLSVCTGAYLLGEAGALDGRDVTTWYNAVPRLAERYPAARVHAGRRFVDSGEVVTTAGVSAGIDGSLHLVARLWGRKVADQTARYMEYHWSPEPYLAATYPSDNPRLDAHGRAVAAADELFRAGRWDAAAPAYRELVEADPTDGRSWYQLGYALHAAGRLDGAAAAHRRAAEHPAHRANALYNLACAEALRGHHEAALDALEAAVTAGFANLSLMTRDGDLDSIRDDPRFTALVEADR